MSYEIRKKRIKILPWSTDLIKTEMAINDACKEIEGTGSTILSIKIFDEVGDKFPSAAIVYDL